MDPYLQPRKDVIACCQWLCRHGYFGSLLSAGGNVSVRIPGEPVLVITPSGKPYMDLVPKEICVVDFDLNRIAGGPGALHRNGHACGHLPGPGGCGGPWSTPIRPMPAYSP